MRKKTGPKPGTPKPPGSGRKKGTPNKSNLLARVDKKSLMHVPWTFWKAILEENKEYLKLDEDFEITLEHKQKAVQELTKYLYPVPRPPKGQNEKTLVSIQIQLAKEELEQAKLKTLLLESEATSKGLSLETPLFDPDKK